MKKVKLVLFGAGVRGQYKYAPYVLNYPYEAEFAAVVEPDKERRDSFAKTYGIPDRCSFAHTEDFFGAGIQADAIMICTQDQQHYEMARTALTSGYHIMLEKPMATTAEECIKINMLAKKTNRLVFVCHVLRYFAFFKRLKSLIKEGRIGQLMSVQHNENVGFFHMAHSFVRGNWRDENETSPIILQKCCHDFDILSWLTGSKCEFVSSFGKLSYFTEENRQAQMPHRCIEGCPYEAECPYSAPKIYLGGDLKTFPSNIISPSGKSEEIVEAIRTGPYGRCVFHCDNNVVDHQSTILEYENGVTACFSLSAFTHEHARTIRLMGTKGEIRGHIKRNVIEIHDFNTGDIEVINLQKQRNKERFGMDEVMADFIHLLSGENISDCVSSPEKSIESHLLAFAAEKSRHLHQVIRMKEFTASYAKALSIEKL